MMENDKFNKMLSRSCSSMFDFAQSNCSNNNYLDETESCCWYHSVWQFLRRLDCVSAPQWHAESYNEQIREVLIKNKKPRILISGTADYSLLHLIVSLIVNENLCAEIDVIDICNTPIKICEWYLDNLNIVFNNEEIKRIKSNITVRCLQKDLFKFDKKDHYDLICTDAFLTRFPKETVNKVLDVFGTLLRTDGCVITTVRIHEDKKPDFCQASKDVTFFRKKVSNQFDKCIKDINEPFINKNQLMYLATKYIIKMESFQLGNEKDIIDLFNECKFDTTYTQINTVPGETKETNYLFIVARKKQ